MFVRGAIAVCAQRFEGKDVGAGGAVGERPEAGWERDAKIGRCGGEQQLCKG